jgi:signal transduction histidine kinase
MRLKTKLVLAITTLVFLISGLLSLVYVSQLLHSVVQQSYDTNRMVANQIRFALQNALESGLRDRKVDPNHPSELRYLSTSAVRDNAALQAVVDSVNRYSLTVYDINIGDSQSSTLLSTDPENEDKPLPVRPDYKQLLDADPLQLMQAVFGPPAVYDVVVPLQRNGEPFASVHVGVRTTLLRAVYAPWLSSALTLMGFVLATALIAAFLLSNLALEPLEEISRQLDYWTAASEETDEEEKAPRQDMAARVSNKIDIIGQRMRNVEEVFSALKENLDQILGNLQDGILLFTGDGRAVLVSEAARRFLSVEKESLLGLHAREIFDRATVLGQTLREAFDGGITLVQEEILTETGRRIQASLDFIHDDETRQGLGALVTLHDLESAEEIESELELSRRMAAIGRLTSGVGHEVKNPINAIVLHLQLLRNKLAEQEPDTRRHMDIIDSEIRRLDRVVQTLVDFTRPRDLHLEEVDLRRLMEEVAQLAAPIKVDVDLMKQAILNVVLNGVQAMPQGGSLNISARRENNAVVAEVRDHGGGIPQDLHDKIFELYFTTKKDGSGIGLAQTYQVLQWHYGSVDFESAEESGTVFRFHIPAA